MSESFPTGISEAAFASVYDVAIQPRRTALDENSNEIEGKATLIAEPINDVVNDATTDIARIKYGEFVSLYKY